jgi:hypothetical protein
MRIEAHAALLGARPETDLAHRLEEELRTLQARIEQLAIALHAPLSTQADVERILQRPSAPAVAMERRQPERALPYCGPERRTAQLWDELRALIVLRYQLCSHLAAAVGAPSVQALLDAAQAQLQRDGFALDSAGMAL